ncbi:MAG: UDP-N-acetylmuramate--L-alanine ligase [Prolixibacteraceae bacterium]|nr:UDP-N-acetylmuramate--L-alanine ligase [Prolixibacteraceae bacterium]
MNLDFKNIKNIYFLGIGGIGMSALARYSKISGKNVAGYDLTETVLTHQLTEEGINIHYIEDINQFPITFNNSDTLIVRTPAVPDNHSEFIFLQKNNYQIVKRSELLGFLTSNRKCIAVSGTHGKTSVTTMLTLLLKESGIDTGAFLGGISRNFNSNLVLPENPDSLVVTEADEYDRSFLQLFPSVAVITSIDADHLDIYGDYKSVFEAFHQFISNVPDEGTVLYKKGIGVDTTRFVNKRFFTYSTREEADFYTRNVEIINGAYQFDIVTPDTIIKEVRFNYPGRVNVENILAASSAALLAGADPERIKEAASKYQGVQRRFDICFRSNSKLYIDDYAHHPEEIRATIESVKELYPGKKILGVFQPHLYSRTKDFVDEFAGSLDLLDEVILMDIYPAREIPIPGVTSEIIAEKMKIKNKGVVKAENLISALKEREFDILITMGAGNIDKYINPICEMLGNQ